MSLAVLIIGVILQCIFALIQFGAILIMAGSLMNKRSFVGAASVEDWVSRAQSGDLLSWVLKACCFVLPALSLAVSGSMIYMYLTDSENLSLWWHAVPVLAFAAYLKFVFWFYD